ncbi:MAG: response regulator, partial [Pseudomonadota bacterium]
LIVFDELARDLVSEICQEIGFHVCEWAKDGAHGLRIIEKEKPDIVVTDLVMPGMDGLTLARTLRDPVKSPNPLVPIILMSASISKTLLFKARDAGINEMLAKPLKAKLVFDRLFEIIERPRDFVVAPAYVGPDRRRRNAEFDGADRRG